MGEAEKIQREGAENIFERGCKNCGGL